MKWPVALVLLLTSAQPAQPAAIRLVLSKPVCAGPCSLTATVLIPHHPDNRRASVVWGYETSASVDWPLEPNATPAKFDVAIKDLPKGQHTIYAVLFREKDGQSQTFEASQQVSVR